LAVVGDQLVEFGIGSIVRRGTIERVAQVFEWFTNQARQCVVLGQEEAWVLKANAIETKDILLGLRRVGDEVVAGALTEAGVPAMPARTSQPRQPEVHIPFTPGARNALRRAQEESTTLGDQQVRPGHMLLALLRGDGDDGAIKMLQEQGVDVDWLRNRVTELLGSR
jgi:ATP-dependent Clp protease ATP-binding subunit ClpC